MAPQMKKTSLKNQNIITGNKSNTKNILVGVGIVILLYVLAHILWSTFPFLFKPAFQVTAPFSSQMIEECNSFNDEGSRKICLLDLAKRIRNPEPCKWLTIENDMVQCLRSTILINSLKVTADLSENTCATFPESTKEDCFIAFVSILPENSFYNYYSSSHNYSIRGSNITLSQKICARAPDPRRCEIMAVVDWIDEMGGKVKNNFNFTKSLTESLTDSNFTVTQLNSSVCEEIITYRKESDRCYGYSINYFGQDLKLCDKIQDKQDKPPSCYVQ